MASDTPLTDASKRVDAMIGDIEGDSAQIAVAADQRDGVTAGGGVRLDVGKPGGVDIGAGGGYSQKSGWFAGFIARWRKRR